MSDISSKLTGGSLLTRNTLFSLVGQVFPILAAIFSIPILINELGVDGFGVLTLAWMVTGYFGFLDLGIGRALMKMVSEKLGEGDSQDIPLLIWTALMLTVSMGLFASLIMSLVSPILVDDVFNIPLNMHDEVERSFYILAFSVPVLTSVSVLRDLLSAYQRFDLVNIVRVPVGSLTFLGPLLILPFSDKLSHIIFSLLLVRILEWIANFLFCARVVPDMLKRIRVEYSKVITLLRFGGWISISNVCGPAMLYADRLIIGSVISVSAVSYYAASFEIISRLMIIPGAIVGVLFPAFGAVIRSNPSKAIALCFGGIKYTFILICPLLLIIFICAHEGLNVWLGEEFAARGARVLQWLAIGAFMVSLSYFPAALLHAAGRPDLTAKLHLIESSIYILALWILIERYGIEGAAIAWVARAILDNLVLFSMAGRILNITYPKPQILLNTSIVVALLFGSMLLPENLNLKLGYTVIVIGCLLLFSWKKILTCEEKSFVLSNFNKFKAS